MNSSRKYTSIAIIDHVGIKSGMNYYDDGLMDALNEERFDTYIFSNYSGIYANRVKYYEYYQKDYSKCRLLRLTRFIYSTFKSSRKAKRKNINMILMHIFSFEFASLILVLIPRIFSHRIGLIVHDIHSLRNNDNRFFRNLMLNYLSNHIIVHNRYSYKELLDAQNIYDIEKIHIIKHGSFCKYLQENKNGKNIDLGIVTKKSKKYILFFGQIKKTKGLNFLIEAMDSLDSNVHLIIAGKSDSKYSKTLLNSIKRSNLINRISIINRFIEHDEMVYLFNCADLIVLPYIRIYQSGVALLSMSIGLPILASNLDPFKEIISHESNGLFFNSTDKNDLINKINKYINNTKLLHKIAEKAKHFVDNEYSWSIIAEEYVRLIDLHQRKQLLS